jgi:hypothetical protein
MLRKGILGLLRAQKGNEMGRLRMEKRKEKQKSYFSKHLYITFQRPQLFHTVPRDTFDVPWKRTLQTPSCGLHGRVGRLMQTSLKFEHLSPKPELCYAALKELCNEN